MEPATQQEEVWDPYQWEPAWNRRSQVHQDSQIPGSASDSGQEGPEADRKGTNR
jgi:hypothetical protein